MRVLAVNAGSTSLKLAVVDAGDAVTEVPAIDRVRGVQAVGHRFVSGAPADGAPIVIDPRTERRLATEAARSPLHGAPALAALAAARRALPDLPHVAVFDSGFHATLDPTAATYAVPRRWRDDWGIRRIGYHGLSVAWAAARVRVPRLVVCHLGGGCSVTAVRDGRSVDTTMGFTPLEGVPMATRSGSVDPGVLVHLLRDHLSLEELEHALEHECGLLALAGTARMEEIEMRLEHGDVDAALAFDVFALRVAQAVAAMAASLGGIDAVVFTGGIGERSERVRAAVLARLEFLRLEPSSVRVVEAREELAIANAVRAALDP